MTRKPEGADAAINCLPFARVGAPTGVATATTEAPPQTLNALGLVDLCRVLDVPVGLAIGTAMNDQGQSEEMDLALKRELLEMNRAYARIPDGNIRRALLQLVKTAAGPH